MLLSFNTFNQLKGDTNDLQEKLIVYGNRNYGNIVFLAGGASSGKGFARQHFLDTDNYKVRDIDQWKIAFLTIANMQGKYPEIQGLDLRQPSDVLKLHAFVSRLGVKHKTLDLLLNDLNVNHLPNILFDITLSDLDNLVNSMPYLLKAGYNPKNIHLTWILTNYNIAIKQNQDRARVVPEDILLTTHAGAASTMYEIIRHSVPHGVDGRIDVILNNPKNTIIYTDDHGRPIVHKGNLVIKDFMYLNLKRPGQPITTEHNVLQQLFNMIKDNIPKTYSTMHIFQDIEGYERH